MAFQINQQSGLNLNFLIDVLEQIYKTNTDFISVRR